MLHKTVLILGLGLLLVLQLQVSVATGGSLSDPTKPDLRDTKAPKEASPAKKQQKSWELSCIIHSSSRKLAVINGEILNIGESINGGRVLDISANSVTLSHQGKRHELLLISDMQGNHLRITGGKQ